MVSVSVAGLIALLGSSSDFRLAADIAHLSCLPSASAIAALSALITLGQFPVSYSRTPACLLLVLAGNLPNVLFAFWGAVFPRQQDVMDQLEGAAVHRSGV